MCIKYFLCSVKYIKVQKRRENDGKESNGVRLTF